MKVSEKVAQLRQQSSARTFRVSLNGKFLQKGSQELEAELQVGDEITVIPVFKTDGLAVSETFTGGPDEDEQEMEDLRAVARTHPAGCECATCITVYKDAMYSPAPQSTCVGEQATAEIQGILQAQFPQEWAKWDKWNFKVYAPMSLDDMAHVTVVLINEDTSRQNLFLRLGREGA